MIQRAKILALLAIGAALLPPGDITKAAPVNFGTAFEFVDSSDFDPLAHIIYAINGGNAGDSHTVNIGNTPVFFESVLDASNVTTAGGTTFSGAIGALYGPDLPAGHVPLTTDQVALDEVLASQHYVDGDGATFSLTLQNLSVGQNYRLQVIGPADSRSCCSLRTHDVASVDGGIPGTVHRFADLDGDTNMHVTTILGDFTADAIEQEFLFGGGVNGGGQGALLLSSDMPFQIAQPQLTIDRTTGNVVLENVNPFAGTGIRGYSLLSAGGALDPTEWLSIANNYDLSSGGAVDNNDNWTVAAANATELSEFNFASPGTTGTPGDAAPLGPEQAINLGNSWFRTPIEDVVAELAFGDGAVEQIPVVYTGAAPLVGDLNSDGVVDAADWQLFKDGSIGPDLSTVMAVAAYRRGDLDGDFDRDLFDFTLFKNAYDGVNGDGALAAVMSSSSQVPEPASLSLVLLGLLAGGAWRFRRRTGPIAVALFAIATAVLVDGREARAVSFDFGAPFEFEDSGDIDLSLGFVAYAVNAGSAGDSQTVDVGGTPVFFESFRDTANMSITSGTVATFSGTIGQLYATPTDQPALDEILNSHGFNDAAPYTLRLENLEVGRNYGLQVIGPADTRGCCAMRIHTVESADGGAAGDISRNQDLDTSGLGHVLSSFATFTAGTPFQDLVFAGTNNAGWGGLILTTDTPTKLQLIVNTSTGNVSLENNTGSDRAIDSYQIVSPGGSLDPNGWNSISDRATPLSGFPQGSGSGDGWESDSRADGTELVEWFLETSSGSNFAAGASIDLGAAYDDGQNSQDLELYYRTVQAGGAVTGDYNNNAVVDAADYTVWRDNLGAAVTLPNDTTPGSVDAEDYVVWRGNFGAGGSTATVVQGTVSYTGAAAGQANTAVPEPSSCLILLAGLPFAWLVNRRRVRG